MTTKEQKSIDDLQDLVRQLINGNREFGEKIIKDVEGIQNKVDAKYTPVNLEQDILRTTQESIAAAVTACLTGYSSPLTKLVTSVVDEQSVFLRQIISDSFNQVIRTENFKESVVNAFSHKVAKSIISQNDSLFSKVVNDLKQDAAFKSKMTLAVAAVVEECMKKD